MTHTPCLKHSKGLFLYCGYDFYTLQTYLQVLYDPQELTEGQIIEVIEDAGFEASILRDYETQPILQVI